MTLPKSPISLSEEKISGRLLQLAALFVILFGIALTLSPAARQRGVSNDFRWSHWVGILIWLGAYYTAHRLTQRFAENSDPYILPLSALLTGWGILSVWRLSSRFGLRQSIWLAIAITGYLIGHKIKDPLTILRQYKYLWLTLGLLLTGFTLIFGANPIGIGPKLWLGCCGFYLQPSEPLKLLLIIYLSAYLADRQPLSPKLIPLLMPTVIMIGLALTLLVVQRDLGTASIFLFIYTGIIYSATNNKKFLFFGAGSLALAGIAGYVLFDLVRIRVDAWINPWIDPSGRSYQIVQALIAMGSGGIFGRGPGLGNPGLVPVALSDFIYTSITEEFGLVGSLGLILLFALLILRGFQIALNASTRYHRYLATGISIFLAGQSLLIIGGTIRMLPLTGVTLPFVSYGGSSLVSSFLALFILTHISQFAPVQQPLVQEPKPIPQLSTFFAAAFLVAGLVSGWWSVVRGPDLQTRTDNARRVISDRFVERGNLLDRNQQLIHSTSGEIGSFTRTYYTENNGNVFGYAHPVYGLGGSEAALDGFLRGTLRQDPWVIWGNHLLYGQPPPGLDVQLSIDLDLQEQINERLHGMTGAVILLNAQTGEILVMSSSPNFDPALLDVEWSTLLNDESAPLLNRATQGTYPIGNAIRPLISSYTKSEMEPDDPILFPLYDAWFATPPESFLDISAGEMPDAEEGTLQLTPLQFALAISSIANQGNIPAPRFVLAVENPVEGWDAILPLGLAIEIGKPKFDALKQFQESGKNYWQNTTVIDADTEHALTWFVAGTLPDSTIQQFTVVILLETESPETALSIGEWLMETTLNP